MDEEPRAEFDRLCEDLGLTAAVVTGIFIDKALRAQALPFGAEDEDVQECQAKMEFFRKSDIPQEERVLTEEDKAALERFGDAMKSMQEKSVLNGNSKMTMDEIDAIIADCRRERREKEALAKAKNHLQKQPTLQVISSAILEEVEV
ncbi:MAG: hypothetical protein FWG65_06880 [Turicibacter sp.]|nr:hypothetical protein [Turicibacter sp.]